jgi:hypothetical protein
VRLALDVNVDEIELLLDIIDFSISATLKSRRKYPIIYS